CDCNEQCRVRHVHCEKENSGQRRIDQRDGELRSHHRCKAAVEVAKPRRHFIAANRVKVVLYPVRRTVRIQASFKKKTPDCYDCENTESQRRSNALGKIGDVAQIMRFLSKGVSHDLSEAFKVGEW